MAPDPFLPNTSDDKNTNGPTFEKNDNWVSFGFVSGAGYDKIMATVHGDPEFVAEKFGIQDFNGKISQLMKQAVEIDKYFKKQTGGDSPGKA